MPRALHPPTPPSPRRGARLALAATVLVATAAATPARATEVNAPRTMGLGLVLGEPNGLSGKLFTGPENAWDAGVGLFSFFGRCRRDGRWESCGGGASISLHADYLWQYLLLDEEVRLSWHFGAGGRVWIFSTDRTASDFALGARVPLGLDLAFRKPEFIEVFLEFTPALYLLPAFGVNLEPALGARVFF